MFSGVTGAWLLVGLGWRLVDLLGWCVGMGSCVDGLCIVAI